MDEIVLAFIPRMIGKCRIRNALRTGRSKAERSHGLTGIPCGPVASFYSALIFPDEDVERLTSH